MIKVKNCLFVVFMLMATATLIRTEGKAAGAQSALPGSAAQEQVHSEDQPAIAFDATSYDAGEVREGDAVHHTFKVKNTGKAPLEIKQVRPG